MAKKSTLPTTPNDTKPGYLQPIFNDELNKVIDSDAAKTVSYIFNLAVMGNYKSEYFKRFIVKMLTASNLNPMWVVRQQSPNGAHVILELDVNGVGTGIHLQILGSVGIYNLFVL